MNKALLAVGVAGVLAYNVPIMTTMAISTPDTQAYSDGNQPRTAGLIRKCTLTALTSNGKLYLSGSTVCNATMQSVGYKNIVIEYSSDNSHWHVENDDINDLLISGRSYYLNNYELNVVGGYYYRVSCTHYAKESSSSSQSMSNTSNSVWIN